MLAILFGFSLCLNVVSIGGIILYFKLQEDKNLLNDSSVVDKNMAKDFLDIR